MAQVSDRAEALRRLAELGVKAETGGTVLEAEVTRSGEEVYAGGDVARLLVKDAHLTYREGGDLVHAWAVPGDTILVTVAQAKRLDGLGVTVEPDASDDEVEAALDGEVTDEQLRTMSAADLIAHVGQNPDDRDRVRTIELERDEDKRRKTVLEATSSDDDDEELDD